MKNKNRKTIIVGAGLGGLVHGIMLKKACPDDEVVIYDSNKRPGGFCAAFKKTINAGKDKVEYTVNIPLITSDFGKNEPFDLFLKYIGVENIEWEIVNNIFQYYPLNEKPFSFTTKNGAKDLLNLTKNKKEKKKLNKFFVNLAKFYRNVFYKCYINPTVFQSIKMLLTMPKTVFELLSDKTYLEVLNSIGIESQVIKDILGAAEAFMGVDIDKVTGSGELLMIQTFLENNSERPAGNYNFQSLSDKLADKFIELGGMLNLNTEVESVSFNKRKAGGVLINGKKVPSDIVVLAVAQDRIESLIARGKYISKISRLIKKVKKIPYPNSDYYCFYLIEKKVVDENPGLINFAYHIYKLPENMDKCNTKLTILVPNKLYNKKYYVLCIVMFEKDQNEIDKLIELRKKDYKKYIQKKDKQAEIFLKELQEIEPVFKKNPPIKHILTISPASYIQYGSKYPIGGLALTPSNFSNNRMSSILLDNLFITGGASFSPGVWGAMAGGWQGFVVNYEKIYGVKIGNHDVTYKPGLKNLP